MPRLLMSDEIRLLPRKEGMDILWTKKRRE